MKIRVTVDVDIDVDAWDQEYGIGSVTEICSDVRTHVRNMVLGQLDSVGVLK